MCIVYSTLYPGGVLNTQNTKLVVRPCVLASSQCVGVSNSSAAARDHIQYTLESLELALNT